MDKVREMSERASYADKNRRCAEQLYDENRMLKGIIEFLKQQLLEDRNIIVQERADSDLLREANSHLVHATFGAEDQKEVAENAVHRQKIFLSMLAHELRNPIAAISVANSLMLAIDMSNPLAGKMTRIIGRQTANLERLVDDLLDVARFYTGKISLKTTLLQLHDIINNSIELSRSILSQRHQHIIVNLPSKPVLLVGDMVRLSQLFSNLLINASKFSAPETSIYISAKEFDHTILISVKDEGIGIAKEDQVRIFDLFTQAEDKEEHGTACGLGIGLSLVKSIAEMHGGNVEVSSKGINCGSEFTVELPLPLVELPLPLVELPLSLVELPLPLDAKSTLV